MSTRRASRDPVERDPVERDPAAMLALLDQWAQRGWIRDVDLALTRMLAMLAPEAQAGSGSDPGPLDGMPTGRMAAAGGSSMRAAEAEAVAGLERGSRSEDRSGNRLEERAHGSAGDHSTGSAGHGFDNRTGADLGVPAEADTRSDAPPSATPQPDARGDVRTDARADTTVSALALLACALVSHQASRGHLLLNLDQALADPDALITTQETVAAVAAAAPDLVTPARLLRGVSAETWRDALARWPRCGDGSAATPLVLQGRDLYLYRFWALERAITRQVEHRLLDPVELDAGAVRALLDPLFPEGGGPTDSSTDWQRIACACAARARFAVITGGPGTGKTTTVIRLLALLQAQALAGSDADGQPARALRIRLAAPTGKAAARLNESIAAQVEDLDLAHLPEPERVRAAIPTVVSTLHRLLGARPDTRRFLYNRDQPLPLDVVVVDEASLIDVDLMAALFDALPPRARLILIGDKDQLASVEAGAVLGTLCARADRGGYSPDTRAWLQDASGETIEERFVSATPRLLEQSITALRFSYRFGNDSGIGRFARAVNVGEAEHAIEVLRDPTFRDLHLIEGRDPQAVSAVTSVATADPAGVAALATSGVASASGHLDWLNAIDATRPPIDAGQDAFDAWAVALLQRRGAFQLLTPLQSGPFGVGSLNALIEAQLAVYGILDARPDGISHWYEGRPVLVTANDYNLGLMNGDMGIALRVPERAGEPAHHRGQESTGERSGVRDAPLVLRVAFARGDDPSGVRWLLPTRLPRCQTVFAMTVHKAQGSEFDHAALVLPDRSSPVLTRELIYTAATRARSHFTICAPDLDVLARGIHQRTVRASRLFGDDGMPG